MKTVTLLLMLAVLLTFVGCSTFTASIQETRSSVQFVKADYEFSEQLTGEAEAFLLFGLIDLERIFERSYGEISVIGSPSLQEFNLTLTSFFGATVKDYALYAIIKENPEYDIIFYPKFEVEKTNLIIGIRTRVRATARMARLKH